MFFLSSSHLLEYSTTIYCYDTGIYLVTWNIKGVETLKDQLLFSYHITNNIYVTVSFIVVWLYGCVCVWETERMKEVCCGWMWLLYTSQPQPLPCFLLTSYNIQIPFWFFLTSRCQWLSLPCSPALYSLASQQICTVNAAGIWHSGTIIHIRFSVTNACSSSYTLRGCSE